MCITFALCLYVCVLFVYVMIYSLHLLLCYMKKMSKTKQNNITTHLSKQVNTALYLTMSHSCLISISTTVKLSDYAVSH